ncbi:MAG: ubiquinol-cytochrome c reductase iron-sulfur subunit [Candidatus Zixiibacteriota bacterium]
MGDGDQSRRGFLNWIIRGGLLALLGAIFYPIYRFVFPPPIAEAKVSQVTLDFKVSDLEETPEDYKIFKFGRDLGIILITPEGEVKAFSAICTHLSCTVQYRPDQAIIWCACHNGKYDLQGRNIAGPPPRPLEEYTVHVDESTGKIAVAKQTA